MALRERLIRETAMGPVVGNGDGSNGQPSFQEMKSRLHRALINRMDLTKLTAMAPEQLNAEVSRLAESLLASEAMPLSAAERDKLVSEVQHELFGLGPLEPLLADSGISDILVNGPESIYIERRGKLEVTNVAFKDNEHLMRVIERIVSRSVAASTNLRPWLTLVCRMGRVSTPSSRRCPSTARYFRYVVLGPNPCAWRH